MGTGAMNPPGNGLGWRLEQLERLEREENKPARELADRHEVELHGERGVYAALKELSNQLRWVQRALWGLAASVTLAAIVFALGTLGPK
jgi:hypothetical protein